MPPMAEYQRGCPLARASLPVIFSVPSNVGGASCCLTIECDIRAMALVELRFSCAAAREQITIN